MNPSQGLSWASLWQLHLQGSPSICLISAPVLIFQLSSCPLPRVLSQPWAPWWAPPTSPWLWGSASVSSWGDPVWVGCWQHTQGQIHAFTSLFDRNVRADAVLLWLWIVTGILSLPKPPSLTGREQGHCHPRDSSCPVTLRSQRGVGMLRRGRKAF